MRKFLYAAGFSLVLSGVAYAQPAMPPHESPSHDRIPMEGGARPHRPKLDVNGDGKVSLAEFQQVRADQLMRLDANKDGKITEAEFMARPGIMGHDAPPPPPKGEGEKGKDRPMRGEMMEKMRREHKGMMFDMLDTNDDGAITRAEIDHMTAKQFKRLDKNHDGVLTEEELPRPPMKGGRRGHHGSH